jgi:hypothetical protein
MTSSSPPTSGSSASVSGSVPVPIAMSGNSLTSPPGSYTPSTSGVGPGLPIGSAPVASRLASTTPFLPSPLAQASLAPGEEEGEPLEYFGLDEPKDKERAPRAAGGY